MICSMAAPRDRLRELMTGRRLSAYKLGKMSGVSANHLGAILNGKIKEPGGGTLKKLADALGVAVDRILEETPAVGASREHDASRGEHAIMVRVEGVVVGGHPSEAGEVLDEDYPLQHHLYRPWRKVVRVYGDSMYPQIHPMDLILIDPKERVRDNDIALIRVDGETTIKRIFRTKKKGYVLKADNHNFPPLTPDDESIEILGKVIALVERKL